MHAEIGFDLHAESGKQKFEVIVSFRSNVSYVREYFTVIFVCLFVFLVLQNCIFKLLRITFLNLEIIVDQTEHAAVTCMSGCLHSEV